MRPTGHDGKVMSEQAWRRFHSTMARMEQKYNFRIVNDKERME